MVKLLLDTSTERGMVAFLKDSQLIFHRELPFGYYNSTLVVPTIQEALQQTGLLLADFKTIVAGVGPGSYTGIRVGASIAKTLAYVCRLPLVGVCSLQGLVPTYEGSFAAVVDAKMGGVYLITGMRKGDSVVFDSETQVCAIPDAQERLKHIDYVITPNATRLRTLLQAPVWQERSPCPIQMGQSATKPFELSYLKRWEKVNS